MQKKQRIRKLVEEKGVEHFFQHYALYQEEPGALGFRRVEVVFPEPVPKKGVSLFTLLTVLYTPEKGLHEYGCYTGKGIDHPLIQKILQNDESNLAPKDGEKWMLFEQLIQQWQVAYTTWQGW
jgi:hypothetical protein